MPRLAPALATTALFVSLAACARPAACPPAGEVVAEAAPPPPVVAKPEVCTAEREAALGAGTATAYGALASCEDAAGRLVDALRSSQKSLALGIEQRDMEAMKAGRAQVQSVLGRVARVTFAAGTMVEGLEVYLDGKAVPPAALAKTFSADPGEHTLYLKGRRNGRVVSRTNTLLLEEAQLAKVSLDL